jgi:hypothetical protein
MSQSIRLNRHIVLITCLIHLTSMSALSQESGTAPSENIQNLTLQLEHTIATLDSQSAAFTADQEALEDQIRALREELELIRLQAPEDSPSLSRTDNRAALPNIFNPTVSVFGNFLLRQDDEQLMNEDGDIISDRMNLRETEIDFRAAVDPYADGLLITAFESEVPGEFETVVEEGYVTIKRLPLPVFDNPPLGLKLKVGRFRTSFGRFNRLHLHDLPQMSYPRSLQTFLGEEGHLGSGASARMFLPFFDPESALELTIEALATGGTAVVENGTNDFSWLGNLSWFRQFGDNHSFDMSHIVHYAKADEAGDLRAWTYSLDVLYKWQPLSRGQYRSFLLGGQLFRANREFHAVGPDDGLTRATVNPFGFFGFFQTQISRLTYLGVRYDQTDDVDFDNPGASFAKRRSILPYLSWYPSEFLRFRCGYEWRKSTGHGQRAGNSLLAELNFIFGAHPPEPFWVNR